MVNLENRMANLAYPYIVQTDYVLLRSFVMN